MGFGRVSMVLVEYLPSLIGFSNEAIAVRSVWADWFPIEYVFLAPQRSQKKKEKEKKKEEKKEKERQKNEMKRRHYLNTHGLHEPQRVTKFLLGFERVLSSFT